MTKHIPVTFATEQARLVKFTDRLTRSSVKAGKSNSRDWDRLRG